MTTLYIVEDEQVLGREAERALDALLPKVKVAYFARVGPFWEEVRCRAPCVVVSGLRFVDGSGLALCRDVAARCPACHVLLWSRYESPAFWWHLDNAGAAGFVPQGRPLRQLARAVERVLAGEAVWTRRQKQAIRQFQNTVIARLAPLTAREMEIARELALRRATSEIVAAHRVSPRTIEGHVRHILQKLHFDTRLDFAQWTEATGWERWLRFEQWLAETDLKNR